MKKVISDLSMNSILQGALTLMVWGSICYLFVTGNTVPDALIAPGGIILGFYFHNVATQAATFKNIKAE